jgi:3-oxoacyl-[acyl-carrier protein] reductase
MDAKTVLITEASLNVGPQLASLFAEEGANLVLNTANDIDVLSGVVSRADNLNVKAITYAADVGNQPEVNNLVLKGIEYFGKIDVVINNTIAESGQGLLSQTSFEDWAKKIHLDVTGTLMVCQAVLPFMVANQWGRIINYIGSDGFDGSHIASSTTDLGVIGLTRGIAREYKNYNITANCVSLGNAEVASNDLYSNNPRGQSGSVRLGTAEECVFLSSSLASEHSGHITGQCLLVNGGKYFL